MYWHTYIHAPTQFLYVYDTHTILAEMSICQWGGCSVSTIQVFLLSFLSPLSSAIRTDFGPKFVVGFEPASDSKQLGDSTGRPVNESVDELDENPPDSKSIVSVYH